MNKLCNILKYQYSSGFIIGHSINQTISYDDNQRHLILYTPLVFAISFPLLTIFSPVFILNYYFNFTFVDEFIDKYSITRYHQYDGTDGTNNKYAYPSRICIKKIYTIGKYEKS
jgi:hypothetical protein